MKHIAAGFFTLGLIVWASCQLPPVVPPPVVDPPPFEPSPDSITYRLTNVGGRYLRIELLDGDIYREIGRHSFTVEAEGPDIADYLIDSEPVDMDAPVPRDA